MMSLKNHVFHATIACVESVGDMLQLRRTGLPICEVCQSDDLR